MARSVRAAGLYTKEAVATSALSLTHTLAQKYKIKIPYQSAGIHKVPGAKDKWGAPNSSAEASNEQYYGLDCSAFVNWVYANAGFGINSRVYYWGSSVPRIEYSETNGDIGDVLVYGVGNQSGRHVRLIIGKTDTEFIIAEASSSGVAITTQKFTKSGDYQIQKSDYLIDVNKNTDYYLNTNYPTGY
jgi:cell wall-associated NlpC family hydrolase